MGKKQLQTDILEASYPPEKWLEVLKLYFGAKSSDGTNCVSIYKGNV